MNPAQQPQLAGTHAISPYPAPPEYAKSYTTEAIASGSVLPPPPMLTEFNVFGEEYRLDDEIVRPLSTQNIRQLYSNRADWKSELKKLNRSAIAAYLDLLDILIRCPDHPDRLEKINDLRDIFINMHHLINEYRPIQARDTLKSLQKLQLDELEETLGNFKTHLERGKTVLRTVLTVDEMERIPVPEPNVDLDTSLGPESEDEGEESAIPTSSAVHPVQSKRTTARATGETLRLRQKMTDLMLEQMMAKMKC